MALKPGTMTGTEADFLHSMAAAIESAFLEEWKAVEGTYPSEVGQKYWRLLFAAIAQGIVRYLEKHAEDSFRVHSVEAKQEDSLITSSGTISLPFYGEVTVQVAQDPGTAAVPNKVKSKQQGEGRIRILTTGVLHP
jgi:hypothetical protein